MDSYKPPNPTAPYTPSAPSLPESYGQDLPTYQYDYHYPFAPLPPPSLSSHDYGYEYGYGPENGPGLFPKGTNPDIIRAFERVDSTRRRFINDQELQQALSYSYHPFTFRTIRFLIFLFRKTPDSLTLGPSEFAELWSSLDQWKGIFQRYDRDKSGKIDAMELRDVLYSLDCAIPASVLHVLISKYGDGSGRKAELNFATFIECGMIVKGLTEKFKEKDQNYIGSATFTYDGFMNMVLPFLVWDDD